MSGTINGNQVGTRPYLRITWEVLSQDIPGNRSRVRLRLYLVSPYNIQTGSTKSGVLQGVGFSYSGGHRGTGSWQVNTRDIWVGHSSNGSKTETFSASYTLNITWYNDNSYITSLSVSGTATLPTIPRASTLNSFSIDAHLKTGTANKVNLGITRASTSFTHDIALRHGSHTLATWNGQGVPSSLNLTAAQVNTLLGRMSSDTTTTLTLRVQTKSGSTSIGSVLTRNATARVHDDVQPTATGLSVAISGNGHDKDINKFVQNISRVTASFSGNATGGATVTSEYITIRRVSGGANSMTINGESGTSNTVTSSGTYEAIATVRDSRSRQTTQRVTFTVHAYAPPRVTNFNAARSLSVPTLVTITRAGSFTPLGSGDNVLTILVDGRERGGYWFNIKDETTTGATFSATDNSPDTNVIKSYEYRIHIEDSFGNSQEATATVSTQRVLFDKHKDLGIGIGKLHENGALDVAGDVYLDGDLRLLGQIRNPISTQIWNGVNINDIDAVPDSENAWNKRGNANLTLNNNNNALAFILGGNQNQRHAIIQAGHNAAGFAQHLGTLDLNPFGGDVRVGGAPIVESGENSNGRWVRFYDGTQICYYNEETTVSLNDVIGGFYYSFKVLDFARPFIDRPACVPATRRIGGGLHWSGNRQLFHDRVDMYLMSNGSGGTGRFGYIAIGRWK